MCLMYCKRLLIRLTASIGFRLVFFVRFSRAAYYSSAFTFPSKSAQLFWVIYRVFLSILESEALVVRDASSKTACI